MPMICPSCGAENPDHAAYCNLCLSTVGFECAEYTTPPERDEGFSNKYPSSFSEEAPKLPPDDLAQKPPVSPVDVGQYGMSSGEAVPDTATAPRAGAAPLDIGQYGTQSGQEPHEPAPLPQDYSNGGKGKRRRRRR